MKKYKKEPEKGESKKHEAGESKSFEKSEKDRKYRKSMKLGGGGRFQKLKGQLAAKGAKSPGALAAYIGRKKYGAKKMAKLSAHSKKARVGASATPFSKISSKEGLRLGAPRTQGKLDTGTTLLKKAMGKLAKYRK